MLMNFMYHFDEATEAYTDLWTNILDGSMKMRLGFKLVDLEARSLLSIYSGESTEGRRSSLEKGILPSLGNK